MERRHSRSAEAVERDAARVRGRIRFAKKSVRAARFKFDARVADGITLLVLDADIELPDAVDRLRRATGARRFVRGILVRLLRRTCVDGERESGEGDEEKFTHIFLVNSLKRS